MLPDDHCLNYHTELLTGSVTSVGTLPELASNRRRGARRCPSSGRTRKTAPSRSTPSTPSRPPPKTSGGRRPLPRRARSRRAGGRRRMSPRSRPSTSPHKLLARAGRLSSRNPLPPPLPSSLPTRRDPRDCGDPWGRTDGGAPPTARSHGRIPRTQERKGKKREKEIAPLLIRQARAARRARRLLQLQELLRFARVRQLVWLPLPPRLASPRLAFRFGANK